MKKSIRYRLGFNIIASVPTTLVMIFGLIFVSQSINTNIKTRSLLTTISTMENTIRHNHDYLPKSGTEINPSGTFHEKNPYVKENNMILTPWNGQIHSGGGNSPETFHTSQSIDSHDYFYISVFSLPKYACIKIASNYLEQQNVAEIYIRTNMTPFTDTVIQNDPIITIDDIPASCGKGNSNDAAIIFKG